MIYVNVMLINAMLIDNNYIFSAGERLSGRGSELFKMCAEIDKMLEGRSV